MADMSSCDTRLICRLKSSVEVDLSHFPTSVVFSMGWVSSGKPHIIERGVSEDYCVVLYDKKCGVLDTGSSKALHALTKLSSLSVRNQAYVGMDQNITGHCLVVVNILAPPALAPLVISTIVSSYGTCWSDYLTISNHFSKDKHIAKLLSDSKKVTTKRPHQPSSIDNHDECTSSSNDINTKSYSLIKSQSTSVLETTPRKRIKLSCSLGNVSSGADTSKASSIAGKNPANDINDKQNLKVSSVIEPVKVLNSNSKSQIDLLSNMNSKMKNSNSNGDLLSSSQSSSQCVHVSVINKISVQDNQGTSKGGTQSGLKDNYETNEDNLVSDGSCSTHIASREDVVPKSTTVHSCDDNSTINISGTDFLCDDKSLPSSIGIMSGENGDIDKVRHSSERLNITVCNSVPDIISKLNVNKSDRLLMKYRTNLDFDSHKDSSILKDVHGFISPTTSQCVNVSLPGPSVHSSPLAGNGGFSNSIINSVIRQEPISPPKVVNPSGDDDERVSKLSGICNSDSDLPESIKEKLYLISQDSLNNSRYIRSSKDGDGLPNLMDERGTSNICHFLLRRDNVVSSSAQNLTNSPCNANIDKDDDDLSFPDDFLTRRRKKHHDAFDDEKLDENVTESSYAATNVIDVPDDNEPTVVKDAFDEIFDSLSEFPKNIEMQPCRSVQCAMLPHQKVALNWMILRENTNELPPFWECIREGGDYFNLGTRRRIFDKPKSVNGGILADDMGLGKTLTTIALILTNHIDGKSLVHQKNILPLNASEICDELTPQKKKRKSTKLNSAEKKDLKKPGFLFRQMFLEKVTKKKKNVDQNVKKEEQMFPDDNDDDVIAVDSIINNLPVTSKNVSCKFSEDDKSRKSTLIVCPMSVLSNWTDQLDEHVHPSVNLKIYLYYGPERIRDVNYLKKHDIIIKTYGTLTYDYRAAEKQKKEKTQGKDAPLHLINWLRVVLDEGHVIRNSRSQQTLAANALNASRRWILTGTVIQNRMTDLWSMIRFLRIDPFSERKWWNAHVAKSIERRAAPGQICFNRIQKIVKHIAIRRLKTDEINGKPLVQLPKREVIIKWVTFSEEERKVYDGMQKDGKFVVSRYFRLNTIFKNYANILVIIMRLRQLCCHPKLCTKAIEKLEQARSIMDNLMEKIDDNNMLEHDLNDEINAINEEDRQKLVSQIMMFLASGDSEECSICLEILREPVITRCAHIYCSTCINEVIENADGGATCPLCRSDIDRNTLLNVPVNDKMENGISSPTETNDVIDDEDWQSSAKIDSLMECLNDLQREEPGTKSLVVSQFTSFLDIVEKPLKDAGFQFCRLDGTMKQADRVRVMNEFKDTDGLSPTIMLLSLTAGGVGLNLISACRVFLLDPAWNPAVEEQCFDRCHRLGQMRDVKIYKFLVKDSVEDRMLILQEKKRKLMHKAFGGTKQNAEQRRRAVLRDISTLLDLNLNNVQNPVS